MESEIRVKKEKRGRRTKNQVKEVSINQDQTKFFIDLSHEKEHLDLIFDLLKKCNEKNYGKVILFKDLCLYSIKALTEKDILKIQEGSLSEMEKVQRALDEHNKKTNSSLSLGEYLVKKLGIN